MRCSQHDAPPNSHSRCLLQVGRLCAWCAARCQQGQQWDHLSNAGWWVELHRAVLALKGMDVKRFQWHMAAREFAWDGLIMLR